MAFTLIIDIHGLCLLAPAPDPADPGKDHMHVLLPDERAGQHGPMMEPHFASIRFHQMYNARGNTRPDRQEEPFEGRRWDLTPLINTGVTRALPEYVGDVQRYVQPPRPLPSAQVRRKEQENVKSHLVLTAGGISCRGPVPHFRIGGEEDVRMVGMIRWIIPGVPGSRLDWKFEDLEGLPLARQPEPLAPDRHGIIRIELLHAPDGAAEDKCDPEAHTHFPGYYALFWGETGIGANGPMPHCLGTAQLDLGSCQPDEETAGTAPPRSKVPNVFTCMIGKTTVG
jgi:hypothetical protein